MEIGRPNCPIWSHMVGMLDGKNQFADHSRPSGKNVGRMVHPENLSAVATVRILGRQSISTISVAWHDPTSCHYGEQVWKICIARHRGICALSHEAIHVGDLVYRPSRLRPKPVNLNFMILAAVVENIQVLDA
ncbi:DUF3331 domain-containing protein [Burkholderia sp. MR1-5-21]